MKKIALFSVVVLIALMCSCCGPYAEFAGTYSYSDSNKITYTVTLKSNGDFRFERKFPKTSSMYGSPIDNDNYNLREGTFSQEGDKIIIKFSYYEEAEKGYVHGTAEARIVNNKLIISGNEQINGTFIKQ